MHSTGRNIALYDYRFKVYPVSWRLVPSPRRVSFSTVLSIGYSKVLTREPILDGVVYGRRDGPRDCGPLLYLLCHTVAPWYEVLLCRMSHSLSLQMDMVAETLQARNPCHKQLSNLVRNIILSKVEVIS